MTSITPITANVGILANRAEILQRAAEATEALMQASKSKNFNIREYAKKGIYELSSARLEGTTLGARGASLKLLVHKFKNKAIFAIVKKGKVLGAKGYFADKYSVTSILEKLCKKGKIKEEELEFAKAQLNW